MNGLHFLRRPLLLVPLSCVSFLYACSKDPQPSQSEIEQSLKAELPAYARVSSLSIEAMQNMGTKVEPLWQARFRTTVQFTSDTFAPDGAESGVAFVRTVKRTGDTMEFFGRSVSKLYAGAWRTSLEFDGEPIKALGQPEAAFAPKRVIIRGTAAETEYFAEKKQAGERANEQYRRMLAEAPRLLVGTWRDQNSLASYNADGAFSTKFDTGATNAGRWTIDGDIVLLTILEENSKPLSKPKEFRTKLLNVTQSEMVTKDLDAQQREWRASRAR